MSSTRTVKNAVSTPQKTETKTDAPYGYKANGIPRKRPLSGVTALGIGRQKGSKNKVCAAIRDDILESYQRLGGIDYLEKLGREHPTIYARLLAACIPKDLNLGFQESSVETMERMRARQEALEAERRKSRRAAIKVTAVSQQPDSDCS